MTLKFDEYKLKQRSYYDFIPSWSFLFENPIAFIAFGFGSGLSRIMPGTVGTLVALPISYYILMYQIDWYYLLVGVLILFILGVYICDKTEKLIMRPDYGGIVLDEIVAMMLILFFIPKTLFYWILAFLLFRLFDITKPFPIKYFDSKVHGGLGIMLDDIIAALFSLILIKLVFYISLVYQ